jgi:hypothetical protein
MLQKYPTLFKSKQTLEALVTTFDTGKARVGCRFFPRSGNLFGVCQNVKPPCKAAAEEPIKPELCYLYRI